MKLTKFEVTNYGGFNEKFTFDFTTSKRYDFNKALVDEKTVKHALVYGPNGSGKSSLCMALMDITNHLTDKERIPLPNSLYFNGDSQKQIANFAYEFTDGKRKIRYEYCKLSQTTLAFEKLFINEKLLLEYNYIEEERSVIDIPEAKSLNTKGLSQQLSIIKYIGYNTNLPSDSPLKKLLEFANKMLCFKTLSEGNRYIGYRLGCESLAEAIVSKNKVQDFKSFLGEFGLNYDLVPFKNNLGMIELGVRFQKGNIVIPFDKISSSGTRTLELFYFWSLFFDDLSFLIIDEFDAYYQYDTAKKIIQKINSFSNFQSVVTTHNLSLLDNEIVRPDCCYIIANQAIKPLSDLVNKKIREGNNLEKMYKDGQFSLSASSDISNKEGGHQYKDD